MKEFEGFEDIDGLDATVGLRQALGREALYLSLLRRFVSAQADAPARIAAALAVADRATAERIAHTLKSVSAQIGAGAVRALAERLEQALRDHATTETIGELRNAVAATLSPLVCAIAARLPSQLPAENSAPAMPPESTDPDRLRDLCLELEELLRTGDFSSARLLEENEELLRAGLGVDFPAIATAIHDFDYAGALEALQAARRK